MKKGLFLLSSLVMIFLLISVTGCGRKDKETTAAQIIPVKTTAVAKGSLAEVYSTTGTVEAKQTANISAKVGGRISRVAVQMGDYVSANQLLFEIEKEDYLNQNKQAKAALAQAESNFKQNKDNLARKQKLFTEDLISQQEFDAAQTQFDVAESQLKQAQANAAVSDSQLKNTEVRAPFAGQVGFSKVNLGEMVSPGTPLMSVVDLSQVYVTVNLSDSYIGQTRQGQNASVIFSAYPEQDFKGQVVQIAPAADPVSKTFPVKIMLNNRTHQIKAGMLAEVKLNFNERSNVIKIPIEAVIDEIGTKSVFLVKEGTAHRQVVKLGVSDGKMIEIISGVSINDQVIILGQNNLEEGSKVVVK